MAGGRIRSVHPKICESEDLVDLPAEMERTYVRLWTHCDDEGRAKDNPLLIKAAIFPLHEDMTAAVVDAHLAELARRGLIQRYEVDGKRYLAVVKWAEYQRPQKKRESVLPPPSGTPTGGLRDEGDTPTGHVPEGYGPVVGGGVGEVVGEGGGDAYGAAPLDGRLSEPRHFIELVEPSGPVAIRRETQAVIEQANSLSTNPLTPSEVAKLRPAIKEALEAKYAPAELAAAIAASPYKTGPAVLGELRKQQPQRQPRRQSVGDTGLTAAVEWVQTREGA